MLCPVSMTLAPDGSQSGQGGCILYANDGDQVFAKWTCKGEYLKGCAGQFTLNGGTGEVYQNVRKVQTALRGILPDEKQEAAIKKISDLEATMSLNVLDGLEKEREAALILQGARKATEQRVMPKLFKIDKEVAKAIGGLFCHVDITDEQGDRSHVRVPPQNLGRVAGRRPGGPAAGPPADHRPAQRVVELLVGERLAEEPAGALLERLDRGELVGQRRDHQDALSHTPSSYLR